MLGDFPASLRSKKCIVCSCINIHNVFVNSTKSKRESNLNILGECLASLMSEQRIHHSYINAPTYLNHKQITHGNKS